MTRRIAKQISKLYWLILYIKMGSFDDLLVELEGTGWYQKRILYFLLCPIFFLMPFAFLNQIFLLHMPGKGIIILIILDPRPSQNNVTYRATKLGRLAYKYYGIYNCRSLVYTSRRNQSRSSEHISGCLESHFFAHGIGPWLQHASKPMYNVLRK